MMTYSADEMMAVAASRRLTSGSVCFVGIGLPSLAANLARRTHAPGLRARLRERHDRREADKLPLSIGDGELAETADAWSRCRRCSVLAPGRPHRRGLPRRRADRPYGNLNSTVIGDYATPKVRLPGGGGAPEIATSVADVFVMLRQTPRAFVERLDFKTTRGDRVRVVITDLGILEPRNGELTLTHIHPGTRSTTCTRQRAGSSPSTTTSR